MAQNQEADLRTGKEVESAVNMVPEDDDYYDDNGDYGCNDCDRDVGDEDSKDSGKAEDTKSIRTVELDGDLYETLSKMVLRLCSVCENFFKGKFKIRTQYLEPNTLEEEAPKCTILLYHH